MGVAGAKQELEKDVAVLRWAESNYVIRTAS